MVNRENIFKIIAFFLIVISISLNFKVWVYDYTFLGYNYYSKKISIKPTLITTMISLFLFGGYIIRNLNEILNDFIKILFFIIDIIFFSGFIAMFADGKTNIFGFSSQGLILVMVALMWIGLKSLLRYILLVFVASSTLFISQINEAMGFFGTIYILCAFFSFAIQIYTNIFPNITNFKSEFFGPTKEGREDQDIQLVKYNKFYILLYYLNSFN